MTRFIPLGLATIFLFGAVGTYVLLSLEITRYAGVSAEARATASGTGTQELFQKSVSGLLTETAVERAGLAGFVAQDNGIASVIDMVDSAAKRNKVDVTIGSVVVGRAEWKYHEPLEVTFSAQGSFVSLAKFATDIESLPVAGRLVSMTAEATEGASWFETFTVEFVKTKAP